MVRQAHHEAHPGVSRVGAVSGWKPTGCLVLSLSKDEARPKRTQGNGLTVTGFNCHRFLAHRPVRHAAPAAPQDRRPRRGAEDQAARPTADGLFGPADPRIGPGQDGPSRHLSRRAACPAKTRPANRKPAIWKSATRRKGELRPHNPTMNNHHAEAGTSGRSCMIRANSFDRRPLTLSLSRGAGEGQGEGRREAASPSPYRNAPNSAASVSTASRATRSPAFTPSLISPTPCPAQSDRNAGWSCAAAAARIALVSSFCTG